MEEDYLYDKLFNAETLRTLERQSFAPKIIIPHPQKVKEIKQLRKNLI